MSTAVSIAVTNAINAAAVVTTTNVITIGTIKLGVVVESNADGAIVAITTAITTGGDGGGG
jgi:hypothetical protein